MFIRTFGNFPNFQNTSQFILSKLDTQNVSAYYLQFLTSNGGGVLFYPVITAVYVWIFKQLKLNERYSYVDNIQHSQTNICQPITNTVSITNYRTAFYESFLSVYHIPDTYPFERNK